MNERRTYGDAVAHSHRLDGAPTLITRPSRGWAGSCVITIKKRRDRAPKAQS
jgi:hypothetical protein